MAPWASQVPFQLMLAPRRTAARFEDDGPLGAALLHDGLSRLRRLLGAPPPLNLWVRTAPRRAPSTSAGGSTCSRASPTAPGWSSAPACSCARSRPRTAAAQLKEA